MADQGFTFTIGNVAPKGVAGVNAGDYSVSQIRELSKRLKAIEPRLRTELMRDVKKVAEPVRLKIKSSIPGVAPLSGMAHGRLAWSSSKNSKGKTFAPNDVKTQFRTSSSGKSLTTTLVRVRAMSPVHGYRS